MRNQVYWYHSCTGINLVTGLVQMIINGHLIIDQVLKEFKGTLTSDLGTCGEISFLVKCGLVSGTKVVKK